jgi:hypothetical protein
MKSVRCFCSFNFHPFFLKRFFCLTIRYGLLFWIISGLVFPIGVSFADNRHRSQLRKNIHAEELTVSLGFLLSQYQKASAFKKEHLLSQLADVTAQRKQILLSLMEDNPGEFFRLALPEHVRADMPEPVRTMLEQRLYIKGELEVIDEDYDDGTSRLRYFLQTPDKRFSLHFKNAPKNLLSSTLVSIDGLLIGDSGETDGKVALESDESLLMLAADGDTYGTITTSSSTVSVLPNTFGEQKVAVLLVNFQDKPDNKPWSLDQVDNMVFSTVSDFFLENSYGQTWFAGDVYGWYTIDYDSTACSTTQIAKKADSAVVADGIDLSAYNRYIYIFPRNSACGWSGVGTVGGDPSRAWINGKLELKLIGHEIGHNFGLQHSKALECGATTLGSNCQIYEYGDRFDIMGNYTAGHLNAFQKTQLGWLGYGNSPPVTTAETSGTYSLEPFELGSASSVALKILKGIDPITLAENWYYLEYRQAFGFDSFLAGNNNVLNGVLFHTGNDSDRNTSFLLDMTPESTTSAYYDWEDPALESGMEYFDPDAGLVITTVWIDGKGATVDLDLGTPACVRANPSLLFSPSESQWVEPGTPVNYTVTVTNKDNDACPVSEYYIEATPPSDWNAALASPTLILEPGASVSTTLTVTSPNSATDGFYSIEVTGTNIADLSYNTSGSVTYVVSSGSVNEAPVAMDDSALTIVDVPVTIAVLANDFDPDGDSLQVTSTTQGANGWVVINTDNTVTYTPAGGFTGNDGFTYTISDGNGGTASANVFIRVEAPVLTISGLSPNSVKRGGKVNTILSGSGFAQGIKVQFQNGEGPAPTVTGVTMMDGETLSVSISTKSGGPARNLYWDVVLTTSDGRSVCLEDGFVVTP